MLSVEQAPRLVQNSPEWQDVLRNTYANVKTTVWQPVTSQSKNGEVWQYTDISNSKVFNEFLR
jgi:hypothetical protein